MKCKSACIPLIWICEGLQGFLLSPLSVCWRSPHIVSFLMRQTWYSPGLCSMVAASTRVHLWGMLLYAWGIKELNKNVPPPPPLLPPPLECLSSFLHPASYVFLICFCASEAIMLTIAALKTGTARRGWWRDEAEKVKVWKKAEKKDLKLCGWDAAVSQIQLFIFHVHHFICLFMFCCRGSQCKRSSPRQAAMLPCLTRNTHTREVGRESTFSCFSKRYDAMQFYLLEGKSDWNHLTRLIFAFSYTYTYTHIYFWLWISSCTVFMFSEVTQRAVCYCFKLMRASFYQICCNQCLS